MNLRVSRGQFTDDTTNNNCDGSNTFRYPTQIEAPMPPYDLYPVTLNGTAYLAHLEYPLGSTVKTQPA
jgi:hypothetical protein